MWAARFFWTTMDTEHLQDRRARTCVPRPRTGLVCHIPRQKPEYPTRTLLFLVLAKRPAHVQSRPTRTRLALVQEQQEDVLHQAPDRSIPSIDQKAKLPGSQTCTNPTPDYRPTSKCSPRTQNAWRKNSGILKVHPKKKRISTPVPTTSDPTSNNHVRAPSPPPRPKNSTPPTHKMAPVGLSHLTRAASREVAPAPAAATASLPRFQHTRTCRATRLRRRSIRCLIIPRLASLTLTRKRKRRPGRSRRRRDAWAALLCDEEG